LLVASIEDLRQMARKRLPRTIYEYADGGSYQEITRDRNRRDLDDTAISQRVMADVFGRSVAATLFGQQLKMPLGIGPTGLTGLFYRDGEISLARAAEKFGVPFCLSTMSICSIEEVRAAVSKPFWFQLYVMRDRGFSQSLVERAIAARCSALVVTLDVAAPGVRFRDVRNGLSVPPKLTFANVFDILSCPRWALGMLTAKRRNFGNLAGHFKTSRITSMARWVSEQYDSSFTWKDFEWLRHLWPGDLIVKGIMDKGDAQAAVAAGANAIVVSNHGGRQLDGAKSTASVLPGIVDVVAGRVPVLFDGGIRSGQDVFKALALGASFCLTGRAHLYGLAAMGEAGVSRMLEMIHDELDTTMALAGVKNLAEIDRSRLA
jgi:L-lactate dehydrogenase (cytochrome)